MDKGQVKLVVAIVLVGLLGISHTIYAQFRASDPGPRRGAAGAGGMLPGLSAAEQKMFIDGLEDFAEEETVADGVGPRFNFVSCAGCHAQPAIGGSSPADNPLFRVVGATDLNFGARNVIPSFITRRGPVREARVQFNSDGSRDGGVHALFVIAGHPQAPNCNIQQEDFERQVRNNNIVFRIPTPVFGAGLIEHLSDDALQDNLNASSFTKRNLGISGRLNRSGNDGTVTRFGWKAQNKSLLIFSGEAYNVEMGITNEAFQQEREESTGCQMASRPNDVTPSATELPAIVKFANFQRFLAPPTPSTSSPGSAQSIARGRDKFTSIGCALCHTPEMQTGTRTVGALSNQRVRLFSDLALHAMGPGLADDILQGGARGDEFRTAPLWGLGQRLFFLHDGRSTDLIETIRAHKSSGNSRFGPSEANAVVDNFNNLNDGDKQDLLNFLRSL
jgi:CxxC motif-containing protein (DUF1111 family)